MGLMACVDCGKSISDSAASCLHCGRPYAVTMQPKGAGRGKSKIVAALLAIFLGGLGVHKFYLNQTASGLVWILLTLLTAGFWWIVSLLEAVIYMCYSDKRFNELYDN